MSLARPEDDLAGGLLARAQAYGILARLLAEPRQVREDGLLEALRQAAGPAVSADDLEALARAIEDGRARPREIEREYVRLFLKSEVSPYEGSYVPGMRFAQEVADIAGFLRAFGLRAQGERPDHLASELEFLAFVTLKEWIARAAGREPDALVCRDARSSFIRDHLGRWLRAYEARLREEATLALYPSLVTCVRQVVEADAGDLGVVVEPLEEARADEPDPSFACRVRP